MTPFDRLGRFVVRRAWWVVGAWVALLLVAIPFAPQVPGQLSAGGFILDDLESARAKALLESELGVPPSALVIVFSSPTLEAGTPAFEAAAAGAIRDIPGAPHVARVVSHSLSPRQVSADRHTAYDVVFLDLPPDDSPDALPILRERLHEAPGLEVALAGGPAFYGDVQTVSEADLRRSELISLPLAALALIVVFGSVVAAGVPLVVGGAAVIVALAGIFVVASFMPMSIFVLNLATLLGLGLGVDYSLLLTSRFREELALRPDGPDRVPDAVRVTVATAGRAIFFSGLTVLLGPPRAGPLRVHDPALGRDRRRHRRRPRGRLGADPAAGDPDHPRTAGGPPRRAPGVGDGRHGRRRGRGSPARVMRHPVAVLVPTLLFLLVLGSPFLHVRFNAPDATILPPEVPSRAAFDRLQAEFGEGEFAPIVLAIRTDGAATSPANLAALYDYSRRLAAGSTRRPTSTAWSTSIARLTLAQYTAPVRRPERPARPLHPDRSGGDDQGRPDGIHGVHAVRAEPRRGPGAGRRPPASRAAPLAPPAGMTVLVGGGAADVADVVDRVRADFPRTALFIIVSTYLVLFVLLRSVVLPAKALVMNTLSIVASFGALVWIFQDGNLSGPLGFQPLGFVETTQPVILFCVLFGLSMDYEVFLLTRMKEVWDRTGDNVEAVARGMERSGRIVTSAALIVVLVAGSFAFADIVLIKALGVGMAIAVALDATVIRALLVPATMRLLGRWNWWMPATLERFVAGRLPASEAEVEAAIR